MSDDATKREKGLQGIRGWLLLVAAGVVAIPDFPLGIANPPTD